LSKKFGKLIGESIELLSLNLKTILPFIFGLFIGVVMGVLIGLQSNGLLQLGIGSTFTNQQRHYFNVEAEQFKRMSSPDFD
jgi:hypothetical protein